MNSFRKLKSLIGDEHISGKFNLPWNLDFLPEIGTLILVPVSTPDYDPGMFIKSNYVSFRYPPSPRSFSFPSARLKLTLASRWLESRSFPTFRNLTCYSYLSFFFSPNLLIFELFFLFLIYYYLFEKGNKKFWDEIDEPFFIYFLFSCLINLDREIYCAIYGGFI